MWGSQMLIAPVFTKGAASRDIYLPEGQWYDFWTNGKIQGGKTITRPVYLETMPIYVPAGAILPFDPIRQYTGQVVGAPLEIKVYPGANGTFTLYEDDGISLGYQHGKYVLTKFTWNDKTKKLTISPANSPATKGKRVLKIELVPAKMVKMVNYNGQPVEVAF